MHITPKPLGFSLVELSIVLVILGLLTGGILGGQSLIKAAELRSVPTEHAKLHTAFYSFQEKYRAIPGDMKNATHFWGNASTGGYGGECAAPTTDTAIGTRTCNGNGNGRIGSSTSHERFRLWQHLANAGMLDGTFTGIRGTAGAEHHKPGENCPSSKISGACWGWENDGNALPSSYYGTWALRRTMEKVLFLGRETNSEPMGGAFTAEDVWSIDTKMDDGKPGKGTLRVLQWSGCTTATANTQYETAEYRFESNGADCTIIFPHSFGGGTN